MWPKTVKEAVELILSEMSGRDKLLVMNTKKEDLIKFHLSWGNKIRDRVGLWNGNKALIKDAKESHPDGASAKIIESVWAELRERS